jgi:hypothetical protein
VVGGVWATNRARSNPLLLQSRTVKKSDVEVRAKTKADEKTEGISIKLVSSPTGFNQIDKRWLSHYVKMWKMPGKVEIALKLFLGETLPTSQGRDGKRMFLNELDKEAQRRSSISSQ